MDQVVYNKEACERCDDESVVNALYDMASLDSVTAAIAENAYRRGYCQGYAAACKDSEEWTSSEMEIHTLGKLYDWRYGVHNGIPESPPLVE